MGYFDTRCHSSSNRQAFSGYWRGRCPHCIYCFGFLLRGLAPPASFTSHEAKVYCEKIRDLLNPNSDNLKMRETKQEGVVIQDVTEVFCVDRDSILRVIETGKAHRASAPTLMNAESSRSHSILSILVTQKIESTGRHRKGKLFLVDLAGSEKVSKTGAKGARLEEAKNINRSLTTLGMVINALCDGSPHIPYRDSKLSRLLQDSLGGNSKTTLIICCASEDRHCSETLSTLRFGERAKKIKNHAQVSFSTEFRTGN
jgi:kinesin family member 5